MNKREFQQRAWLTGLLDDCCTTADEAMRRAGEVWDRYFAKDDPAPQPPSEWIRFVDRRPTFDDCLLVGGRLLICYWKRGEDCSPVHLPVIEINQDACSDPNCYWRPIPKLPEAK